MYRYTINVKNTMLKVYRFCYEPVDSNMYYIPVGEEGFVFDPNINEDILPLFKKYGTKRIQIVLTHEHYDHTTGVEWLQDKMEAPVFCQERCARYFSSDKGNNSKFVALVLKNKDREDGGHRYEAFKANYKPYKLHADETYEVRGNVRVGDVSFECIYTPGHSPGSTCYILDGRYVFTGDSLIQNTPTVLRFKTSNKDEFEQKSLPFLKSLDKNMLVFPGHGEPFKINEAKYL